MAGADDRLLSHRDSAAGQLQRHALRLLRDREGQPDALPTSVRFLFYELVQQGVIAKAAKGARRPDQNLQDAVLHLRARGLVPWHWIVDETRSLQHASFGASVADHVAALVDVARLDLWDGVPPPLILTESRSLSGVLSDLAARYLVPLAATNGQAAGFLHVEVAPHLVAGQRVLYLGDADLCGDQIEANTRRVLERLVGPLDWRRIAITAAQIAAHDLPVIQKTDRRYRGGRPHDAVETEALGQSLIVALVRDALDALLPEPLEDVLEREEAERARVHAALDRL
jgi:hypothetical protein